jgi:hypothetical protein
MPLQDLIQELTYKGTQDVADMYQHVKPPDQILGFQIDDVFLYFVCHNMIASFITLNCNSKYLPEIINKLSVDIGNLPSINGKYHYWMDETVALYCYTDDDYKTIRLYYTIKEYDILA